MPQPDSSRDRSQYGRYGGAEAPWPLDPAAPHRSAVRLSGRSGERPKPKEKPEQDGRTRQDPDGNEELKREQEEKPESQRIATERRDRDGAGVRARQSLELEDTGEWVATEKFTLDDELEDTWPNVPARYFDD